MPIQLINFDEEENTGNFLIYNVKTSIVNSLRRIMMADYKNSAFNEKNILVKENNSLLHNEIIKHRLSLVPVKTNNIIKVELNICNETDEMKHIYSDDLKIIDGIGDILKGVLLYKLKPNQIIRLEAITDINTSKVGGIPYRPISTAYFKIIKEIKASKNISKKKLKDIFTYLTDEYEMFQNNTIQTNNEYVSIGLTHTIRDNTNILKNIIKKFNLKENDLIIEHCKYNNIPVYSFNIESFFYSPKEIMNGSIQILKEQLDNFLESEMEVEEDNHFIKLFVKNGTYTIANPLSTFLREHSKIKFAHYNKIHPFDDFLIIQISLYDMSDNYIEILQNTLEEIDNYVLSLLK
jgi:DNA-directed RNA polymerase subunit D